MQTTESSIRIFDIIPVSSIEGRIPSEFDSIPMYEYVDEGIIKENYGYKKDHGTILFYDVSSQSEELKKRYANLIQEIEVNKVIRITSQRKKVETSQVGKIVTILPLDGTYSTLKKEEITALGNDYVTVTSKEEGIEIKPIISAKNIPDNMYLKVNTNRLPNELIAALSSELKELIQKPNGLYEDRGSISTSKNFS